LAPNGTFSTAGSKLMTYGGVFFAWRVEFNRCMKVVFPDPAIPIQITTGELIVYCVDLLDG